MKVCSKPRCFGTASAMLGYDYASRLASLEDVPEAVVIGPPHYALCAPCADRLTPPRGWTLQDLRAKPPLFLQSEPA